MKAIDVGKTVAIEAGKKLVEKAAKKLSASKSQVANVMVPPDEITKKVNEAIAKTPQIRQNWLTFAARYKLLVIILLIQVQLILTN